MHGVKSRVKFQPDSGLHRRWMSSPVKYILDFFST